MLLQLILWVLALNSNTTARRTGLGLLAGVVAGCAVLMRPSWLPFTPLAVAVVATFSRQRGRHAWLGLVMLVGLCAAMAPWWLRNYHVTNRWVFTSLQAGAGLYDGWRPDATGGSDLSFAETFRQLQKEADAKVAVPHEDTFEYRLDRRLHDAAVAWAREHPGQVVQLAAIKLVRMWNVWPNEPRFRSVWLRLIVMGTFLPVMVCGIWAAVRYWPRGWPYRLCLLPAAYFTLLHMVFVSSIRYREPAMLTIIVLAAAVMARRSIGCGEASDGEAGK